MKNFRDDVLAVYEELKKRIDAGEYLDAFVTDAWIDDNGEKNIDVKVIMPPEIHQINCEIKVL